MKNPAMGICSAKEFDSIVKTEVLPAILKAYGAFDDKYNAARLTVATERLVQSISDFCNECMEAYIDRRSLCENEINDLRNAVNLSDELRSGQKEGLNRCTEIFQE